MHASPIMSTGSSCSSMNQRLIYKRSSSSETSANQHAREACSCTLICSNLLQQELGNMLQYKYNARSNILQVQNAVDQNGMVYLMYDHYQQ